MNRYSDASRFLSESVAVDAASLEHALTELRGSADVNSLAMNLIYALRCDADWGDLTELTAELIHDHPARAILLRIGEAATMKAAVYRFQSSPVSPATYSELIEADFGIESCNPAALVPLKRPNLPTVLIWDLSLNTQRELFSNLSPLADHVITALLPPCAPASSLIEFFDLCFTKNRRNLITDLAESNLQEWQFAIEKRWCAKPDTANGVAEIHLYFTGAEIPAEMLLIAAWLSSRLKWESYHVELRSDQFSISFAENRRLAFHPQSDTLEKPYVRFRSAAEEFTCEEPVFDNRLSEQFRRQLNLRHSDPLREDMLNRARQWLKEMEFVCEKS